MPNGYTKTPHEVNHRAQVLLISFAFDRTETTIVNMPNLNFNIALERVIGVYFLGLWC